MHYHAEVWVRTPEDIEESVKKAMAPYNEEDHPRKGFWDWYRIGGRWTGTHKEGYDPETDPANRETCRYCYGTGRRQWPEGPKTCNGCNGTGIMTKWPTQWKPIPEDVIPVKDIPETFTCYTLILPKNIVLNTERWTGKYFQKTWDGKVKTALAEHGITTGYLVTVDYHN